MSCISLAPVLQAATTQKTTRYEAEDGVLAGDVTISNDDAASAGRYVWAPRVGNTIEWTITAQQAGTAELHFGYGTAADRPLEIRVNGVVVAASFPFPTTGGWTTWAKSSSFTVSLNAGNNIVRATAVDNYGPNLDYLLVKQILPLSGEIMTVYDGANLSGASANIAATHIIYDGASIPGGLDNQISSFVLSEGYMAVVAESADGLLLSKVYIAADGPLTVNTLPANLDNAISFIRVVPWKNTRKKGFCGGDDATRSKFDHSWYYSWTKGLERGQKTTGPEYVPMCWDERYVQIEDFLAQDQVTHLLSFNEPDGAGQANMPLDSIPDPVTLHKELQKAGLRLGSPACEEQNAAGGWLPSFMDLANAQGVRVDYINVHWYDYGGDPDGNPDPNPADVAYRLRSYLANVYARHRKPIWLTEFNANTKRPRSVHDGFLQQILPYLDDVGYVERYAYYQWGDTMNFVDGITGELTSTGQIYNDHQSSEAYVSLDLPSQWASADIGTTHEGAALYNGCFTISGSGVGLNGTVDGCRYVYQPVSGDVTITAQVTGQIWRDSQSASGVMIRENLTGGSKQSSMTLSWSQGSKFRARAATDGAVTTAANASVPKYPYWVRLVREGDALTGYQSPDGITWTQAGAPTTISMTSSVYVGMAVTSHYDGVFNDAIFKNVSVNLPNNNNAPAADAGSDQSVGLGAVAIEPIAGAYFEWDAANDTAGDNLWESTTSNIYNWTFGAGAQSPVVVSDTRFKGLTHAYPFPTAQDASNTSFDNKGSNQAATFEFVIDVDGNDGSIFETGGSGTGMQVDIVGGVLRGTVQASPLAQVTYTLTPTDMGRFIHVAFVADPSNDVVKLYVDGVLQDSAAWTGSDWAGADGASLGKVSGTVPSGGSTAEFSGQMALFRYYRNQAFSDADAQTNFAALTGLQAIATLDGSASDVDGDSIAYTWSLVSGPGWVSFSDVTSSNATATFTALGEYTLKLSVYDYNGGRASDLVAITVREPTAYETWSSDRFAEGFTQTGVTDNPDGDNLINLQEFAFGTDPTSPRTAPLSFTTGSDLQAGVPVLMKLPVEGQPDAFQAVFSRRKDYVAAGLVYRVDFSADLSRWTASSLGMLVKSENSAGTMQAVSVPFPASVPVAGGGSDEPPKFFRVGVSQQ